MVDRAVDSGTNACLSHRLNKDLTMVHLGSSWEALPDRRAASRSCAVARRLSGTDAWQRSYMVRDRSRLMVRPFIKQGLKTQRWLAFLRSRGSVCFNGVEIVAARRDGQGSIG